MELDALTPGDHVRMYEQVVSSIDEVCSQLADDEWDILTDCPAWTVKDNLSHLASYEAIAAGMVEPVTTDITHLTHVKESDVFSTANEREVEARRAIPGREVLSEFRDATAARLKHFGALDDEGWEADVSRFPWGETPTKPAMAIRLLDFFYHEQDIRRASDKPGHMDGQVAAVVFDSLATRALPRVIAKKAQLPEGTIVTFDVDAPGRAVAVAVRDGRGVVEEPTADPAARFALDQEAFFMLMGGRRTYLELSAIGRVRAQGDRALIDDIVDALVVVP